MVLNAPLNIHWEITNECNFHCIQCYQQNDERHHRLSDTDIIKVAQDIIDCNIFQISLSGGEPFLVPVLFDVIKMFKENYIDVLVCSNGSYISEEDAKNLFALNVPVQVSLDSADENTNNYIRGHPQAYSLALSAIDILVKNKVDVSVAFCASKHNYKDIAGVCNVCHEHGVKKLVIGEMLPVRGDSVNQSLMTRDEYIDFLEYAKKVQKNTLGIDVFINTNWGFLVDTSFEHAPCTALDRDFAILYNGFVTPCPFIRNPEYYLGNVVSQGIKSIWNKAKLSEFYLKKHRGCDNSCAEYERCMAGCKAEAANCGLPLEGKDMRCIK